MCVDRSPTKANLETRFRRLLFSKLGTIITVAAMPFGATPRG